MQSLILALFAFKLKNFTFIRRTTNILRMARKNKNKPYPKRKRSKDGKSSYGKHQHSERKFKRNFADESSQKSPNYSDEQKRAVDKLLEGIGIPEQKPFVPDPFQIEALEAIKTEDVLVTAPTGSGKTWIAREETRRLLAEGKKTWYTTPLKALTNSKYMEFGEEFGEENVGILTGDRKENANAPLIVGTTEIYRNQLFDSLRSGEQVNTDFVILDEAHYLSDEYRGHVWEEAIILSPPRIRMLLLSATIGNAVEFARWIEEIRGTTVRIINRDGKRPVELRAAFMAPNTQIFPLLNENGKYNRAINQFKKKRENHGGYRRRRR